jgi:hypothetical protein
MTYSIKITDDKTEQAKSLLFFLKSLAETKDYFFLKIEQETEDELSDNLIKELDSRYEHFIKHKNSYKNWDEVKQKYNKA